MNKFYKLIAAGLGTGYLPIAPGTWASIAVCCVFLAVAFAAGGQAVAFTTGLMITLALLASAGCVWLGAFSEKTFGQKDPSKCTLDEWAGQAVALVWLPSAETWRYWLIVVAVAFIAFRLFDIVKPFPARRLEKLPHGWGILADDLVAGVYANVAAQLLLRLWLGF